MKGLYFYLGEDFEIQVDVFKSTIIQTKDAYMKARAKIANQSLEEGEVITSYSKEIEKEHKGVFKYSFSSFPEIMHTEQVFMTPGPTVIECDPELSQYMHNRDVWYEMVRRRLTEMQDEMGLKFRGPLKEVPENSRYSDNPIDIIKLYFKKNFQIQEGIIASKESREKLDFLINNPERISYGSDTKVISTNSDNLPEFDRTEYYNLIGDREQVNLLTGGYEVNKYLASNYSWNNPSIYLVYIYVFLNVNDYQSAQYKSGKLGKIYNEVRPCLSSYTSEDQIERAKKFFTREDEEKESKFIFQKLLGNFNIGEIASLKAEFPEFLGDLRMT